MAHEETPALRLGWRAGQVSRQNRELRSYWIEPGSNDCQPRLTRCDCAGAASSLPPLPEMVLSPRLLVELLPWVAGAVVCARPTLSPPEAVASRLLPPSAVVLWAQSPAPALPASTLVAACAVATRPKANTHPVSKCMARMAINPFDAQASAGSSQNWPGDASAAIRTGMSGLSQARIRRMTSSMPPPDSGR